MEPIKKESCHSYEPNSGKRTDDLKKEGRYGAPVKRRGKSFVQNFTPKTAMEHFLKEVLTNESYSNSIALIENHLMNHLLIGLTSMKVKITAKERTGTSSNMTCLKLPWTSVTFTTMDQFVDDYKKFSNEETKRYFPMAMNQKSMKCFALTEYLVI